MPRFRPMYGIHYEEDNSYGVEDADPALRDSDTFLGALNVMRDYIRKLGSAVDPAPLGMWKHLPGAEAAYVESWKEKCVDNYRLWIIKRSLEY
jgi:hypothetical protein